MIEKLTYAAVFTAIGFAVAIVTLVSLMPPRDVVKVEYVKRYVPATETRRYECTRIEIDEHLRACRARARMEVIKPKE